MLLSPPEPAALVELRDVTKVYGRGGAEVRALAGVSLKIAPGELVAVTGASGSGKSTCMNILGCLDRPTSGSYTFSGVDIAELDLDRLALLRRKYLGFVFQGFNLLARTSALENVELPLVYRRVPSVERRARAMTVLRAVGLHGREHHTAAELSGGQQQRVAIARAIVTHPALLLADEPTGNLDSSRKEEIMRLLTELNTSRGITVVIVTHEPDIARYARRIVDFRDGRIASERREHPGGRSGLMWLATLVMAFREVRRNVMRSALTMLGIVIGVAAVIAMVTLGQSATARVTSDIASLGQNMLIVLPGSDRRGPVSTSAKAFALEDVRAALREVRGGAEVAPTASKGELAVFGNANHSTVAYGSTNAFFRVRNLRMVRGREFSDAELAGGTPACVLGETVRQKLFASQEALDTTIRVGPVSCRVIGVLESKGQSTFGQDQDDFVVMPLSTVQRRLAGNIDISAIYVSVADERAIAKTKSNLEAVLRERRRIQPGQLDDFTVQDTKEIAKTVGSVTGVLTALLGAVAAVSLVVGGIGIMNIMLVSVTERTREIGIRLAIGALAREVLQQFLVEAVVLCAAGGSIGVAVGLVGSFAATRALTLPFRVEPAVVLVAFVFSAAIGIAFGYLPARKAARMNPIEALRHE